MPFSNLLNDRVSLIKKDGRRFDNLPASVQSGKIFTNDPRIPIEDGDRFERRTPSGVIDYFRVVDAGFMQEFHGISAHYQSKVQKESAVIASQSSTHMVSTLTGPHAGVEAHARLTQQIERVSALKALDSDSPEFRKWSRDTEVLVERIFGADTRHLRDLKEIDYSPSVSYVDMPDEEYEEAFRKGLDHAVALIQSFMDEVEQYGVGSMGSIPSQPMVQPALAVFLVHGHDEAARESVARYLDRLSVKPIILHEQANQGRTVVEKLEHHANVTFAVVLLTPDDVGAARAEADSLRPRARQNVVLELGFFVGKLGRQRVCAIHKGALELPSDYMGVLYIPFDDAGGWRLALARELKAAGFSVDMNAAL